MMGRNGTVKISVMLLFLLQVGCQARPCKPQDDDEFDKDGSSNNTLKNDEESHRSSLEKEQFEYLQAQDMFVKLEALEERVRRAADLDEAPENVFDFISETHEQRELAPLHTDISGESHVRFIRDVEVLPEPAGQVAGEGVMTGAGGTGGGGGGGIMGGGGGGGVMGAGDGLGNIAQNAGGVIANAANQMMNLGKQLIESGSQMIKKASEIARKGVDAMAEVGSRVAGQFRKAVEKMAQAGTQLADTAGSAVTKTMQAGGEIAQQAGGMAKEVGTGIQAATGTMG